MIFLRPVELKKTMRCSWKLRGVIKWIVDGGFIWHMRWMSDDEWNMAAAGFELDPLFMFSCHMFRCRHTVGQDSSVQRILLTVFLFSISSDLTGDARLESLPRRRQADGLYRAALHCALPPSGLQPHQSCKTIIRDHCFHFITSSVPKHLETCSYRCRCWSSPRCCQTPHGRRSPPPWTFAPQWGRSHSGHFSPGRRRSGEFWRGSCETQIHETSPINWLFLSTCCGYSKWPHSLPVREAVGGCEDPAGWDQTPPAAENHLLGFAAPEYGSDPRVGFHGGNCSTHDLHQLSTGALAACGPCSWGMKRSSDQLKEAWKRDTMSSVRRWSYLAPDQWVQAKAGPELQDWRVFNADETWSTLFQKD